MKPTPVDLALAASECHTAAVKVLIAAGLKANGEAGALPPLIAAAAENCAETVAMLLDHAADVNAKDSDGRTALIRSTQAGNTEVVRVLLQHGADMDVADRLERTAWMYAGLRGHEEIAALFEAEKGRRKQMSIRAFRVFEENGAVGGRIVSVSLDELSAGDVVIDAAYSSVNYKDALAATGAGKIIRRFPLVGGIDVAGTVASNRAMRDSAPVNRCSSPATTSASRTTAATRSASAFRRTGWCRFRTASRRSTRWRWAPPALPPRCRSSTWSATALLRRTGR